MELGPEATLSVSCQKLISTRSLNSVHMLTREGQELPCIEEASAVESQELLSSEWPTLARLGLVFFFICLG